MNSRERYFAAAEGLPVDRVPVCLWHHYTGENEYGEKNVRCHVKFIDDTGVDVVKISMDGYFVYPFSTPVKTAADWKRIHTIPRNAPFFLEQRERARRVNSLLQVDHPTVYVFFMPFSMARQSTSDELVMAHLRENPEAVKEGMKVLAEEILWKMRNVMEYGGCDGMLLSLQGAEEGRFTVDEYLDLIRPFDDLILREAARYSRYNIAHLCGWAGVKNQLDCWLNIDPGIRIMNWATMIEGISLAEGQKRFFPRPVMGGFDNRKGKLLNAGTEDEIKAYTKALLAELGTTGLILGSDCSMGEDTPHDHFRWAVEACKEFGAGPARR